MPSPTPPLASGHPDPDSVVIELSRHCIERFIERLRPCLNLSQAEEELAALLTRHCEIVYSRPSWISPLPGANEVAWAVVGGDIALPLAPERDVLIATTTLAVGHISHAERDRRRRRKATLRARRRRP